MNIELSQIMEQVEKKEATKELTKGDLERVAIKASYSFRHVLSSDEIESCILSAFWKASDKFNADKNTKFTTYFYKGVVMECLSQKKFNLNRPTSKIYENIASYNNKSLDSIDMMDEISTHCDDPELIYNRFYKNMSVREIALTKGVCSETIRIKIKKNLTKLRSKMPNFSV
jgi:DNA-directed RNA polymerase specialized sigma subunit|tara:strand:+ start:750 stop:1265 length:516 start_codon:yes stop_codon:yes gene_type:complete